jgi:DNA-binding MarR family transcriptional regulator
MTSSSTSAPDAPSSIDDDLRELQRLLPTLFRALRHGGPALREVKPLKRDFLDAGLGERHGRLLLTLASTGPQTVGDLASKVALAPATTSLLVGELDRAGFVERHEDDADRRRTIVSLPDNMRSALEQFAKARLEPLRRTLEKLDPETRGHFIEGLRVLSAEAQAPYQER